MRLAFAVSGLAPRLALSQERPPIVPGLPAGVYDTAMLDTLPGKQPLIKLSYRLPNYETPVSYFKTAITPNDAFFVRYHLADFPKKSEAAGWRLQVGGDAAATALELNLAELQTGRFSRYALLDTDRTDPQAIKFSSTKVARPLIPPPITSSAPVV